MRLPAFFLLMSLTSLAWGDLDHRDLLDQRRMAKDLAGMKVCLEDWEADCPDDVEMLENFGDFLNAGGAQAQPSGKLRWKAVRYYKDAIRLSPARLDLRLKLVTVYRDLWAFDAQYDSLAQTLSYADKHYRKLRWNGGGPLPERPSRILTAYLQKTVNDHLARRNPDGTERAMRLARLAVTFFPKHHNGLNSIAASFAQRGDWEHALKYLLLSNQIDPHDPVVQRNIGNVLTVLGKGEEAEVFYKKAVDEEEAAKTGEENFQKASYKEESQIRIPLSPQDYRDTAFGR
ncbi:MAG TPA: hypothetical protein VMV05_03445 [bacterium]|nr:hypothetical protein [bacterium]